jgi:hypothetical protein
VATRTPGRAADAAAFTPYKKTLPARNVVLGSDWTGLAEVLLASIYPVDFTGKWDGGPTVKSPPTDGNIELTGNWQSPFEHSGIEARAPVITAMLQSGALQSYAEGLLGKADPKDKATLVGRLKTELVGASQATQGRTGLTKVNSTQIFSGAAPIKLPMTLHFRAFKNPAKEVQEPLDQLAKWVLSKKLAADGSIVAALKNFKLGQGFLASLLPSEAPQMVGLLYGGFTFAPLVLEAMSHPLTVPRSSKGEMLSVAVSITLATLTALDQDDWYRARNGQPTMLFNN